MEKAKKSLAKRLGKIVGLVAFGAALLGLVVVFFLTTSRISFFSVSGDSMAPTLNNRDSVVLRQGEELQKDQLVFFSLPATWTYDQLSGSEDVLVKRVAAVPGDELSYNGREFKVNGEVVYSVEQGGYACGAGLQGYSHVLEEDEIFVLGDNALASLDSRRVFCDGKQNFLLKRSLVIDYGTVAFQF